MISYDQAEIGLWAGSLVGKRAKEENKGREQAERRGGVYAPLALLADLFFRFSPLQSLFTG